jgi:hypothetical protein
MPQPSTPSEHSTSSNYVSHEPLGVPETKECILESLEVAFRNGTGLAVASKPTAVCTGGAAT